jgi:hypothetical protein
MAWGAILLKLPNVVRLEDLPHDYQPSAIGTPEEIHAVLKGLFPDHEHTVGTTSYYDETCYVEFNYQNDGIIDSIGIRSNAGPTALTVMKAVCDVLDVTMIDNQSGQIADFAEVTQENMEEYRAWVKRVIR